MTEQLNKEKHLVIGAGTAGLVSAYFRTLSNYDVRIFEQCAEGVCIGSSSVVSENHSGAEYPFDERSARNCLAARLRNEFFFPTWINAGKDFSRVIASQSMIDSGVPIDAYCRANMEVIRDEYRSEIQKFPHLELFGSAKDVVKEIGTVPGVNDVATAFITPQRGINPIYAATALRVALQKLGVNVEHNCKVNEIAVNSNGNSFVVEYQQANRSTKEVFDQISICSGAFGIPLAMKLNPVADIPPLYVAIRQIELVRLAEQTKKNYTCLKLEGQFGGMFSPLNCNHALLYHPPSAHIATFRLDSNGSVPELVTKSLLNGHEETIKRTQSALHALQLFYPEIISAMHLRTFTRLTVNTIDNPRVRRNMGPLKVSPGCQLLLLQKWTMCVVNALAELRECLKRSVQLGSCSEAHAENVYNQLLFSKLPDPSVDLQLESSLVHALERTAAEMGMDSCI